MKININLMTAAIIALSFSDGNYTRKSAKQPFAKRGFWVTESTVDGRSTIVKYYANSISLINETKEDRVLDISKLSVRKYLNLVLETHMKNDSTINYWEGNYEIN